MRRRDVFGLLLAAAATAVVVTTVIVGSTQDEEEFRFAILSTWLFTDALRDGHIPLWTPLLGFGVPQPFIPHFNLHPLMPLLGIMSPIAWVRLLLVAHTMLGAAGMWRLAGRLQIDGVARGLSVCTYLWATPLQNYILTDFWPTHYVVWTTAPWLALMVWRLLEAEGRARLFWSVACGVAGGVVLASTNPGHAGAYWPAVAVPILVHRQQVVARLKYILLTGSLLILIIAPTIVQLAQERRLFDPDLSLDNLNAPLGATALVNAFLSPYWSVDENVIFARTIFMGGPFLLLAIAGAVRYAREYSQLRLIFAASGVLLFTSILPLPVVSARFHYRDPLVLAATLLAGVTLCRLFRLRWGRYVAVAAVVVQLGVLAASAWPALSVSLTPEARDAEWWRGATGAGTVADALDAAIAPGGRLLFTPSVEYEINERRHFADGLGVNALAYRGIEVVNGSFKGVSTAVVSPDHRMFYGRIVTPPALLMSPAGLNVLRIRYVLANEEDTVAPELRRVTMIRQHGTDRRFVLYESPGAWPDAFLLDGVTEPKRPTLPECTLTGLLCTDWSEIAQARTGSPEIRSGIGRLDATVAASDQPRLLVVTQMFRSGWSASSAAGALTARPVLGGFIGVEVPPGQTEIHLRYRPLPMLLAIGIAWITVAAGLAAMIRLAPGRDHARAS